MEAAEGKNVQILEELNRDIEYLALNLRKFIRKQVTGFKKRGVVIGVSGGIDSALEPKSARALECHTRKCPSPLSSGHLTSMIRRSRL